MTIFAVQYLEDAPGLADTTPEEVRLRLRLAAERMPISLVLVGWETPRHLVDACAEEADSLGARFYRWQPLLTGDGVFEARPEWHSLNFDGQAIPGFGGIDSFTFVCPNRPVVQDAVQAHLQNLADTGRFDGFFLDRIRFHSPALDPWNELACFCPDCQRAAADEDFDLLAAGRAARELMATGEGALSLVQRLLSVHQVPTDDSRLAAVDALLGFRQASVSRFVKSVADLCRANEMGVGLDCFSPCLTRMVGQDLTALYDCCDWIKTMSYAHTLGPAGMPFELGGLADWLVSRYGLNEARVMQSMAQAAGFAIPTSRAALRKDGLAPEAIVAETRLGLSLGARTLLGGIALVEMENINELNDDQIRADVTAFRRGGAEGLVLSWDLWYIPLERLELTRQAWSS